MTDKEKLDAIRAEIHRLVDVRGYDRGMANDLFAFMDSLPNEPVNNDLEEASKEWLRPQLDKSYANYGEAKMMELTRFDGYAMLDAIEFGAKWGKEQAEIKIKAQSMAFAHGCPKESLCNNLEEAARKVGQKYFPNENNIWARPNYEAVAAENAFEAGANWQKEQIKKDAIEREVKEDAGGYPYIDATELYDYDNDKPLAKAGDKVKVIIMTRE